MQGMHLISFRRKSYNSSERKLEVKMSPVILLMLLVTIVDCVPLSSSKDAVVTRFDNEIVGGGYNFGYETSDGITRQETAELKNAGAEDESIAIKGSYSWVDVDGNQYVVNYVADENGFQPEGGHIPQSQ